MPGVTCAPGRDRVAVILGTVGFGGGMLEKLAGIARTVVVSKDTAALERRYPGIECEDNTWPVVNMVPRTS